jgi:hypothetical protein
VEEGCTKSEGHFINKAFKQGKGKQRGVNLLLAGTKEKGAHKSKRGAITKESSRLSLRGASPLYQVPLFHFLFVAFA